MMPVVSDGVEMSCPAEEFPDSQPGQLQSDGCSTACFVLIIYWQFSLKLVRGFAWRTPGEHFHLEKENSALFCKAQGNLNTALWNPSWWVPASDKHRHPVMFATTLFAQFLCLLVPSKYCSEEQCPCQPDCWISPPVMWDLWTWQT